jgi:hypothetical protein
MTTEEMADRLHARRSGAGWIAHCPGPMHARGDRLPSLSIGEGENGRTLVHCFGGCTVEAICGAMGIRVSDLFAQPGAFTPKPRMVREAERHIADLRSRLTPRDRVLPVTIVYCDRENLDGGIARALALAVEGEIVQAILEPAR